MFWVFDSPQLVIAKLIGVSPCLLSRRFASYHSFQNFDHSKNIDFHWFFSIAKSKRGQETYNQNISGHGDGRHTAKGSYTTSYNQWCALEYISAVDFFLIFERRGFLPYSVFCNQTWAIDDFISDLGYDSNGFGHLIQAHWFGKCACCTFPTPRSQGHGDGCLDHA